MQSEDGQSRDEKSGVKVRCLFFARYAELVGEAEIQVELPGGATIADAVRYLRKRVAGCDRMPERPLVALNQVHSQHDSPLSEGDELAFLPPLAGG